MEKELSNRKSVLYYSLLFAGTALSVFIIFVLLHKSVIQYSDGYKQAYFWVVEVRQQLEDLLKGEGFHMWSWCKGLGMNTSIGHLIDPFMVIAALFPAGYIELGYTVATVLKMYFGGLMFLAFLRFVGQKDARCVFGPLCYAFAGWVIEVALVQSSFLLNLYLFPLLVLSVEWVYKGRNPIFFIAVVAYYMIRNFYFSYMAAIVIIIYIILRYFAYNDKFDIKEFAVRIGSFILYGIAGCLISSFTMLTSVTDLSGSSTESATDTTSVLFGINYYLGFGERIIGRGMTDDYLDIGLPILVIMLLPVAIRYISRKSTHTMMAIILFIMMMLPFFCSMFNAFGYPTLRWTFTFIFFAVWAAMDAFDIERLRKNSNMAIMACTLAFMTVWTIVPALTGIVTFGPTAAFFVPWNLFAGLVILLCFKVNVVKKMADPGFREKLIIFFTLGAVIVGWNWSFLHHAKDFLRNNQINTQLEESTQRAGSMIDDDGFYRIDQVDGLMLHHQMKYPANENTWWQTKTIYIYNSKLPARLLEFNRDLGNNYGYLKRVYVLSNDNRMGLDTLVGVKYFLGNDMKNGYFGSDEYAGHEFEFRENIDGVNVFENKYDVGLGFAYDKCISESEFLKLSRLEREQALLQAAVIPDDEKTDVQKVSSLDIETDVERVPFEIKGENGAEISFDGRAGTIETTKENATFDLTVRGVKDSQLILSFDNLQRAGSSDITITCQNEKLTQMAMNDSSNQTIPGICNYDLNMGYYEDYDGTIRVVLEDAGVYTFSDMYLSAMAGDNFDKYAQQCEDEKYVISSYDEENVKGTVDVDKESIVFFSIPAYGNWHVYLDGEEAERINDVNIAFAGVEVPAGKHEIVLKYEYRYHDVGMAASALGVLMLALTGLLSWRRKKIFDKQELMANGN
ncbi:MAG: YfhO family protein [Bacillota bacterium]